MQITPILEARIATLDRPVHRQLKHRMELLSSTALRDAEKSTALLSLVEIRRQSEENAKVALSRAEEGLPHGRATDADVEAARLALARERELTSQAQPEVAEIQARAFASEAVFNAAVRFLNSLSWPSADRSILDYRPAERPRGRPQPPKTIGLPPGVEIITPKLPDGDLHAVIAAQRSEIVRCRAEIEEIDDAPGRRETAEARLPGLVADLAARGAPVLVGAGDARGTLRVDAGRIDIGAAPAASGTGNTPRPHDALALAAWLAPDKVLEKLRADLHESYEGVDLQMDPHEKFRRKRELKATILKAERIECAAIWQLIDAGDDAARFRPDTDPRAILGVTVRS